ncbi:MAG: hypothetical protein Q9190_003388 [Brigantiaea leucoxantha]
MTSKLTPSNPSETTVIRQVTPNITTCSSPFARFGRFRIGGRATIVRLQSGSLAIFSPTALTPEVRSTLDSLGGRVAYLTCPDIEHHIHLSDWAKAFPSAKILGVEGLPEKRQKDPEFRDSSSSSSSSNAKFTHVFTAANRHTLKVDEEFDAEFDYEYMPSHANKELVFCYGRDRTLIQADLIFNLPANEQYSKSKESATEGVLTRFFTGLQNTVGKATWQKRFVWYVASKPDREGFAESVRRIEGWDFERIVPCHGDVIESGGKGVFRTVMEWHLAGMKK